MADGTRLNLGSGGDLINTDETEAGVKTQIVKVAYGVDGSLVLASAEAPLPIDAKSVPGTAADGGSAPAVCYVLAGYDGSNVQRLLTDASGFLQVDTPDATTLLEALKALLEGTGTVKIGNEPTVKLASSQTLATLTGGGVAHDSPDSGNPHKVGARARTTHPAAVANDDRSDLTTDKYGRLLTAGFIPDTKVSGTVTLENETSTTVLEAPGASTRLVVTSIKVINGGSTSGRVEILDETTKKDIGYAAKEGGGWSITDSNGLFIVTENKPLKAKALATSKFDVFVSAYKIPA